MYSHGIECPEWCPFGAMVSILTQIGPRIVANCSVNRIWIMRIHSIVSEMETNELAVLVWKFHGISRETYANITGNSPVDKPMPNVGYLLPFLVAFIAAP